MCLCVVKCPALSKINNGARNCPVGDDGVLSFEDTCSVQCNTGYMWTGSDTRKCQSDGSWSGTDGVCERGKIIITCQYIYLAT